MIAWLSICVMCVLFTIKGVRIVRQWHEWIIAYYKIQVFASSRKFVKAKFLNVAQTKHLYYVTSLII